MKLHRLLPLFAIALSCSISSICAAAEEAYPKPSAVPISWELKFEHSVPARIVVETPDSPTPQAYWYLTYTVTNNTNQEQMFLPFFEMVTRRGNVIRSDKNIPQPVFDAIKRKSGNKFLEPFTKIGGELRLGEDEARDGVAIWKEPDPRMGNFTIFVGGLSGEAVQMKDENGQPAKDASGNPIILRKTLQLNYIIRGDEVFPGQDEVDVKSEDEVMR
ncbi:MAG: hypothetical protein JO353_00840 [Phycisphaerae bacterium]|nr:hypothetical protein [Phycisphaerae bacterium]